MTQKTHNNNLHIVNSGTKINIIFNIKELETVILCCSASSAKSGAKYSTSYTSYLQDCWAQWLQESGFCLHQTKINITICLI